MFVEFFILKTKCLTECRFLLELHHEWEDKENVVEFDFLGKDSVRYWNFVPVEKKVREIHHFVRL